MSKEIKKKIVEKICGLEPDVYKAYDDLEIEKAEKWEKCKIRVEETIEIIDLYNKYKKES